MATTYRSQHPFASQPLPALPTHSHSQPSGSSSSSAQHRNVQSNSRSQPTDKQSQKKTRTRTETTTLSFSNSSQTTQGTIPDITCSACGLRLRMDQLGEHVCETASEQSGRGRGDRQQERDQSQAPRDTFEPSKNAAGTGRSDEDQTRAKSREDKRSTVGLTLDMSTLIPPDTTGFLGIGDAGMAGVGRRGFGKIDFSLHDYQAARTMLTTKCGIILRQLADDPYVFAIHSIGFSTNPSSCGYGHASS
jgi:hypothetical protein